MALWCLLKRLSTKGFVKISSNCCSVAAECSTNKLDAACLRKWWYFILICFECGQNFGAHVISNALELSSKTLQCICLCCALIGTPNCFASFIKQSKGKTSCIAGSIEHFVLCLSRGQSNFSLYFRFSNDRAASILEDIISTWFCCGGIMNFFITILLPFSCMGCIHPTIKHRFFGLKNDALDLAAK